MQPAVQEDIGTPSTFRWMILTTVFIGEIANGVLWLAAVPLVLSVERDFHLSASQVAFWLNLRLTSGILLDVPAGLLIDQWGAAKVGRVGFLLFAVGAATRGFSTSYVVLLITSMVYVVGAKVIALAFPKAVATWFPPSELGKANGIYLAGYSLGSSLALAGVQPLFGDDWRTCFRVIALVSVLSCVLWWMFAKDRSHTGQGTEVSASKLLGNLKEVSHSRVTWLLTAIFFLYSAAWASWFTFGFPFLVRFRDVGQTSAGVVLMLTMLGYGVAALTMPALSDRVGYRKPFLLTSAAFASLLLVLVVYLKGGAVIGLTSFFIGTAFGTTNPLVFTIAAEARELGPSVMGATVGIVSLVSSIAGFAIPTVTGHWLGSLASASEEKFHTVIILVALYIAGMFLCGLVLRETGRKGRAIDLATNVTADTR